MDSYRAKLKAIGIDPDVYTTSNESPRRMRGEAGVADSSDSLYDDTKLESGSDDTRIQNITNKAIGGQQRANSSGGTNEKDLAGNALFSGGMMTANPYAVGAGLGLQVLSMNDRRKQADADARYNAKLDQIQRTQSALNNLVSVSGNLRL